MQVYKAFWRLALSKLSSCIVYFIVFLVITIIFSTNAEKDFSGKFESSSVDMCIIDEDNSNASHRLTEYLSSIHNVKSLQRTDDNSLQDQLYYQMISYVLTIPDGFEEMLLSGADSPKLTTAKRADSANGYFVDQQIDAYISELTLYLSSGKSMEEASDALLAAIHDLPEVTAVSFGKTAAKGSKAIYYFFQYLPYVFLMMVIEGLSPILIAFRRQEVSDRIACSSMPQNIHNTIVAVCCGIYSILVWLAFMLIGVVMYGPGQMFCHDGLLCIANSFVFMLISVTITLLISVFSLHSNALSMVANTIGLGMSFLCGIFVPQFYLGDAVLTVSRFLPAYWYVRITNMISGFSGETVSMKTYWTCMGMELLFLAAIFAVFLALSRRYHPHRS